MTFQRGGEAVGRVHGNHGTYRIFGHPKGNMRCECMAWKFSKLPPEQRTCKHVEKMKAALRVSEVESSDPDVEFEFV